MFAIPSWLVINAVHPGCSYKLPKIALSVDHLLFPIRLPGAIGSWRYMCIPIGQTTIQHHEVAQIPFRFLANLAYDQLLLMLWMYVCMRAYYDHMTVM